MPWQICSKVIHDEPDAQVMTTYLESGRDFAAPFWFSFLKVLMTRHFCLFFFLFCFFFFFFFVFFFFIQIIVVSFFKNYHNGPKRLATSP